jgi:hypothetical protein
MSWHHLFRFAIAAAIAASSQLALATVYNIPPDPVPAEIFAGDTVNLSANLGFGFQAGAGSEVNVLAGGGIGFAFMSKGEVNVLPGAIGLGVWTLDGGTLNAKGGNVSWTTAINGAHLVVDGSWLTGPTQLTNSTAEFRSGRMDGAYILSGSSMTIFGSGVYGAVILDSQGVLNIRGGGLAPPPANIPTLDASGRLNLFVTAATINGAPIPGLTPGATVTIPDRGVDLNTVLADGTPYVVPLTPFSGGSVQGYLFYPTSVVTVTLVPEPASGAIAGCIAIFGATRMRRRVACRR